MSSPYDVPSSGKPERKKGKLDPKTMTRKQKLMLMGILVLVAFGVSIPIWGNALTTYINGPTTTSTTTSNTTTTTTLPQNTITQTQQNTQLDITEIVTSTSTVTQANATTTQTITTTISSTVDCPQAPYC